jgi:hypothetical protein
MKIFKFIFLLFCFSIKTNASEIGAVSTATGGGGIGAVEPVDGILKNPAFLRDLPNRGFSFNYAPDVWAISISDNSEESLFPAGLQMTSEKYSDQLRSQKLGLNFSPPRFGSFTLGATASLVSYDYQPSIMQTEQLQQSVLDVGLTFALSRDFGLGIVANRIASSKVKLDENLQLRKYAAFGMSYTYENFIRLRLDVESAADFKTNKLVYIAGMENYMNEWIILRLGYRNDNVVLKDYLSAGLGFSGPQFGLHYAYIADVVDSGSTKHLIDLAIPF